MLLLYPAGLYRNERFRAFSHALFDAVESEDFPLVIKVRAVTKNVVNIFKVGNMHGRLGCHAFDCLWPRISEC